MTGPLLLVATLALAAATAAGFTTRERLALTLHLAGAAAALAAALGVLLGGEPWAWRAGWMIAGHTPAFLLDAMSAFFLVPVAVVGAAGAIYARDYWNTRDHPESAPRGRALFSAYVLCLVGVLTSAHGLGFLVAWELFALSSYGLITLDNRRLAVRRAGWLFLASSHLGTLALFAFFTLLAVRTGGWELGPLNSRAELAPLFWLALVGFGLKAGLFPLHIWLPSAHANAPSHVSAIMSGVGLKMGIYGLVRFSGWLPAPPAAGWVLLALGALGAFLGIAFAFVQTDLKRLLAYCSVENIGVICAGLGAALLAAAGGEPGWGRLVLAGALMHVWNHAAFKSLLFYAAGSVMHATGTREMSRLGGLWPRLPRTTLLFAAGALAAAALPPGNGLVSEWLVFLGLFEAVQTRGPATWGALPALLALAMAGALALAAFAKAAGLVFTGAPRTRAAEHAHESGRWMLGPMWAMAGACLALGLWPGAAWAAAGRVLAVWRPAWDGNGGPAEAALGSLGMAQAGLLALLLAGGLILWRKVRAAGVRRAPTWNCGYAAPTARMQYTAGSFSALAGEWFRWAMRPVLIWRRPRGLLPRAALRLETTPDTVLEYGVTPAARWLLRGVGVVRRGQHGGVQAYIFYVLLGLAAMGLLVIFGGEIR